MIIKTIKYEDLTESHKQDITKLMSVLSNHSVNIEAMKEDNNIVVGAYKDDKIVGLTTLIEIKAFTAKLGLVDEVVVSENHRGEGIASKILEEIVKIAKERKMDLLKVDTNVDNPSNGLYQKVGFIKKDDNLYKLFL